MKLMTRSTCPLRFPWPHPRPHLGVGGCSAQCNLTSLCALTSSCFAHHPHPTQPSSRQGTPPLPLHGCAPWPAISGASSLLRSKSRLCTRSGLEPSVVPSPRQKPPHARPPQTACVSSDCPSSLSPPTALPGSDGEPARLGSSVHISSTQMHKPHERDRFTAS